MAESTTTTASPEKVVFTFEEQVLSSCSLYSMALICVIWGAIRSVRLIKTHVAKKRNIETSIGWKEATRFPISASIVLFGLYVAFKGPYTVSEALVKKASPYVPHEYLIHLETARDYFKTDNITTDQTHIKKSLIANFIEKIKSTDPKVEALIVKGTEYVQPYIPEFTKERAVFLLLLILCFEGCSALAVLVKPIVSFFLRLLPIGDRWPKRNTSYLWAIKSSKKEMDEGDIVYANNDETDTIIHIEYDCHYVITLLFTATVGISHLYKRHWITNNLLGIAFSVYGIENLHLASFKAGIFLLVGLFFYDIFWVFGTDVMTTVAKSIDAPILLQFPQDILRLGWYEASKYSMLGLGDIVVPGIFVALLYRFDHYVGQKKTEKSKPRYYFAAVVVGYMIGLVVTMAVMNHFKAAQPALLYLVPACIIIPLLLALIRGEFTDLWNYTEEHIVNPEEQKQKEASKKTQKKKEKKSD